MTLAGNRERRESRRTTWPQRMVTAARYILTLPGMIGRVLVTVIAWAGAWYVGSAALRHPPIDFKTLLTALAIFAFGTAFAFPLAFVRTFGLVADAWDTAKRRKG